MKKRNPLLLFFTFVLMAFLLFLPQTVLAAEKYYCGTDSKGQRIETAINFGNKCGKDGATALTALILYVLDFVSVGVGVAVVGGIVWGGLQYAASDGDSAKTKQAIEVIKNAVIGLVLFFAMYAGINFLVPGGLFN